MPASVTCLPILPACSFNLYFLPVWPDLAACLPACDFFLCYANCLSCLPGTGMALSMPVEAWLSQCLYRHGSLSMPVEAWL